MKRCVYLEALLTDGRQEFAEAEEKMRPLRNDQLLKELRLQCETVPQTTATFKDYLMHHCLPIHAFDLRIHSLDVKM